MFDNVEVNLKMAKIATAPVSLVSIYLQSPGRWDLFFFFDDDQVHSFQACTLRRLLSWKAIISLLSQGSIGKDTQ